MSGGGRGGGGGVTGIPGGSRKMVQSLKEIVNSSTEQEIYAMLKECNMDPNEAVNRLLAQDPFHEVKSKREKKKESKEPMDSRSRGASFSNYGGRGGDRYSSHGGSNHFGTNESGSLHGRSAYRKQNGAPAYAASSSSAAGGTPAYNSSQRPPTYSDSVAAENKVTSVPNEGLSSSSQPSVGYQSAWGGVPGQVSVADIVKGIPQAKAPPAYIVNRHDTGAPPAAGYNLNSSQSEPVADEWPLMEQPPSVTVSSILGKPENYELYAEPSSFPVDKSNQYVTPQLDDVDTEDDGSVEAHNTSHDGPTSASGRNVQEDTSANASAFDNSSDEHIDPYNTQRHVVEDDEGEHDASSLAANVQQLDLQKDDRGAQPEEENPPPVVIPNHLQLHTPDCLHLSFGSFRSGPEPDLTSSHPMKSDLEEISPLVDVSAVEHLDARNPDYYGDDHLMNTSEGSLVHRTGATAGDYDSPSVPQPEVLKQETSEADQGIQYTFPSAPGFAYDNSQQQNMAFSHQQSSQMQNNAHFSSVMQAYTNSLPNTQLAPNAQNLREDLSYSPFPVTQLMPTKYSNVPSSISGDTMSMSEALRAGSISSAQPTQQTLPGAGAGVATGPALQQHLLHPYSQPSLPLGHFSNMIGYPFLPQSYTYMPSAYQQAFAGNSTYHQQLAAVLPQYKNSLSASSLTPSTNIPPGYGFGGSTSFPGGNFPSNSQSAPTGTTIGYDDVINSQYKDSNHLMSHQQNDNSGMWVHGPGSRAMPVVPANNYYNFQGQNQQQHAGFRQTQQQPSQQFAGGLNYPNFYQSQTGMSLDHQPQQSSRDAALGGSQGQPSKQSQQLWQNSY